jgi:SM-20-related protein
VGIELALFDTSLSEPIFEQVAFDLKHQGYSIQLNAVDPVLAQSLWREVSELSDDWFHRAGIGRANDYQLNRFNRTDSVCWIEGSSDQCRHWLQYTESLRHFLNRSLFLGLFSYESHYARYLPGQYYKRHLDAFQGQANRLVSTVLYLNPGWLPDDGGELVIYESKTDQTGIRVTPSFGTLVSFLSEEFPHEVLPAKRTRFSIAGWYRLNQSSTERVDPPL